MADRARRSHPPRRADALLHELRSLHSGFAALRTLEPSEALDGLFADLMELCLDRPGDPAEAFLADPQVQEMVPHLREWCATAEFLRERVWAERILASADAPATLEQLPFFENYRNIVRFEIHSVRGAGHPDPRRVLMVGSGPLPVTSVLLARALGARVDGLDIDPGACKCSTGIYRAFGLFPRSRVHGGDILGFSALSAYDLVILGASVGLTRADRLRIIAHLAAHMAQGSVLLVRTAHGMRTMLFPQIDPGDLNGFLPELLVRPLSKVINSVIVASKPYCDPPA